MGGEEKTAPAVEVVGAGLGSEWDIDNLEFLDLLAREREDGNELFHHSDSGQALLRKALESGRTPEWCRGLIDYAGRRGVKLQVWAFLLGTKGRWVVDAYDAENKAIRQRNRNYEALPDEMTEGTKAYEARMKRILEAK